MKLSEQAWSRSSNVIAKIKQHPFNKELAQGTLALDKFAYYIEQDTVYLRDFARCHAIIAAKIPLEYVRCFLHYADYAFFAEQEVVHHFFRKIFRCQETGLLTPATLSYTSYLLRTCSMEQAEIGVAAILPCFWVYREVGCDIAKKAAPNNQFARWIETYTGKDFGAVVEEAIAIFDAIATKTTDGVCQKMVDAFYNSTCLEWHFWNDAYNKTVFDDFDDIA
jgi:thiaminase (transcriptional activator TenA)